MENVFFWCEFRVKQANLYARYANSPGKEDSKRMIEAIIIG
jgi:hypothetical protein